MEETKTYEEVGNRPEIIPVLAVVTDRIDLMLSEEDAKRFPKLMEAADYTDKIVIVRSGGTTQAQLNSTDFIMSTLNLTVRPPDAKITIDELPSRAGLTIKLMPGQHMVRVEAGVIIV